MMDRDQLLALWAKTDRDKPASGAYHPLICHMLDVAAVTDAMWRLVLTPALRRGVSAGLGLDEEDARRWIVFLAGLHDVGKASPGFQNKVTTAATRLRAAGLTWSFPPRDPGHGIVSALTMQEILPRDFALAPRVAHMLATAIGGHHGVFPSGRDTDAANATAVRGDAAWTAARLVLANTLADVIGVRQSSPPEASDNATAMTLAGLVSVADWIGSDDDFFQFWSGAKLDVAVYFAAALAHAERALEKLGWLGWTPSAEPKTFAALFPRIATPRPVQELIGTLPGLADGPGLLIVELPMGEGKTEAAFYAADRWGVALGQRGCYVAMPTMATSNQMFSRAHEFLAGRYPDSVVNLQLLHSHAALAIDEEAASDEEPPVEPGDIHDADRHDGAPAAVAAGEWFTRRKRGLLAPFGVGTVDQALLAALKTRHVFVRLFGLSRKTIIFDEVHAYDVYMSTLFERLLEWLGALGSSAVVLSATLPAERRQQLVAAYARGAGWEPSVPERVAYPRITWALASGVGALSVKASAQSSRRLNIEWVDGHTPSAPGAPFALGERLRAALAEGGCAAVICNTVNRAQQVYQALQAEFCADDAAQTPEIELFHARYPFEERDVREKRALARFGKPGGSVESGGAEPSPVRRPRRAILVATQVVEQSLDLDFDVMVSEHAPVDLLLQRSGRLQRHDRPERPARFVGCPTLWICRPELDADGVPAFGFGNEKIYDPHILLRSWLELRERTSVAIPEEMEELIEFVYDRERPCPTELDATLRERWDTTLAEYAAKIEGDEAEAEIRRLKPPSRREFLQNLTADAREEDAPEVHAAHQALTRLAGPSVGIVCLYATPAGLAFDRQGTELVPAGSSPTVAQAKRLLRRSVTVSDRRVVWTLLAQETPTGWRRSALLRHQRRVVFDADGRASIGDGDYWLELDPELGLKVIGKEGA